jgi:hypothetical protein
MSGCEGLRKKFTRKKKAAVKMPRIYQVKKYEKKPSPELYNKHYAYWLNWQSELLKVLGQNRKKDTRCIEEVISNLKDMQNILVPEMAEKLQPHIDKMWKVRDVIVEGNLSQYNKSYVEMTVSREYRYIRDQFSYKHVKDHLKTSFEDESEETK